jgi:hypothetical protein
MARVQLAAGLAGGWRLAFFAAVAATPTATATAAALALGVDAAFAGRAGVDEGGRHGRRRVSLKRLCAGDVGAFSTFATFSALAAAAIRSGLSAPLASGFTPVTALGPWRTLRRAGLGHSPLRPPVTATTVATAATLTATFTSTLA